MTQKAVRKFSHKAAVREAQRAFISLSGASGGGKTKSALELATGLVSVTGGKVFVVDTENKRALKYAAAPGEEPIPGQTYAFEHVEFEPPFDPDSYLAALRHCEANGAGAVIFDSMSHEHAGEGGRLDSHDKIAGDNAKKNYMAWAPNSAARNRLLWGGFFRSPCHIILCFRAKDKTEQRGSQILDMGFTPIGGQDFIFEADASILFMPQAMGVPTWHSELRGERSAIKLPAEFQGILNDGKPISAAHGVRLAQWLNAGGAVQRRTAHRPMSQSAASATAADRGAGAPSAATSAPYSFAGEEYDPGAPRLVDPPIPIAQMTPGEAKSYAAALAEIMKRAPPNAKRAWFDRNAPEIVRLKAKRPDLVARLEEIAGPTQAHEYREGAGA